MHAKTRDVNIAVLDDYQGVALDIADWSEVRKRASLSVFSDHLADQDALAERLQPFNAICVMRERTPMQRSLIERLPRLELIASTGPGNASIDLACAAERGIKVKHTGYNSNPTIELTWALILASARHLLTESSSVRTGGWQRTLGDDLAGKTLGVIGLGKIGSAVAKIGLAFGMDVIAWSQNLTANAAAACGVHAVSKEDLLRAADFISIHLVLSKRTVGLIGESELSMMKPSARVINTSRGPIILESALVDALTNRKIAGAAIDVFDIEPLPPDHPFRRADNVVATPHIGYVSKGLYERFYGDTVDNIVDWLDGR